MKQADSPTDAWKQVPVLIRMDIYAKSLEKGTNISDICNKALSQILDIPYKKPEPVDAHPKPKGKPTEPEKPETKKSVGAKPRATPMPVMDAEEYLRTGKVEIPKRKPVELSKETAAKPEAEPVTPHVPPSHPLPKKAKRSASGEFLTLKKFYESHIEHVPENSGTDARVTKDHLYQEFLKWCVANSLDHIPDRKQFADLLKKRLNVADITVKGHHYWANIRVK